jgi:Peptidase A4 family
MYSGWYEMYPKFPVTYTNPVRAGDAMSAYVNYVGNGYFTLYLHDQTQGWSQTVTQLLKKARRGSAEVITEAPWSGGVLPLADFQTVNYAAASANGAYQLRLLLGSMQSQWSTAAVSPRTRPHHCRATEISATPGCNRPRPEQ